MLEPRCELDLALEPVSAELRGELGAQHLEGDRPLVPDVAREIDGGHAAAAELALDRITAGEGVGQLGRNGCHGSPEGKVLRIWRGGR